MPDRYGVFLLTGLLKNNRLLRCTCHSLLQRTKKYASFLMTSYALHLGIFEQPISSRGALRLYRSLITYSRFRGNRTPVL